MTKKEEEKGEKKTKLKNPPGDIWPTDFVILE